ncbi:MAG TPA: SAM-dependent methyltransferase [Spirochaetia bacterium]|nr:SAM-dependent methyltransferase [Spirochaetia bacterium]
MAPEMPHSIVDASKPNAGRIYDFALGGNHNFEVDRQAAQQILKVFPQYPEIAKVTRWFLGEAVRRLARDGYSRFIDFASGLPTNDHVHEITPPGTQVIYSDWDLVTVTYGQEIVGGNQHVRYVQCDAGRADELLKMPIVPELFSGSRKAVFGFNGISWFLKDDELQRSLRAAYDWAEEGSRVYMTTFDSAQITPAMRDLAALFGQFGQPVYLRSQADLEKLMAPWKVIEPGFRSVEEWFNMPASVAASTRTLLGGFEQGVILGK